MRLIVSFLARFERVLSSIRLRASLKVCNVSAAPGCRVAPDVRLRVTDGGTLVLGSDVVIDRLADITVKHGRLEIGDNTYVGQGSVICSRELITIGANCLIAEYVTIRDQDHRFGCGMTTSEAGFETLPICIMDNVWLGAKATITKGVKIGQNVVVGANSVVTRDIPPNVIVAGAPAKVIKQTDESGIGTQVCPINLTEPRR